MIDFVKSRLFLPLDLVEACMLCGLDDTDMLGLRDRQGKRYIDDRESVEAARWHIISRWSAQYARLDYDLWRAYTIKLYEVAMQRMDAALSGRIGRRLRVVIEQGIIEISIARYRLLTQADDPGGRRLDITDGQRLGARRLQYGGLL